MGTLFLMVNNLSKGIEEEKIEEHGKHTTKYEEVPTHFQTAKFYVGVVINKRYNLFFIERYDGSMRALTQTAFRNI